MLFWCSSQQQKQMTVIMTKTTMIKFTKNKLICNLPQNCVLVINTAPYHNPHLNTPSISSTHTNDAIKWSTKKSYENKMYKPELNSLVKSHKPRLKMHKRYLLLTQQRHSMVLLPLYLIMLTLTSWGWYGDYWRNLSQVEMWPSTSMMWK